MSVAEDMGVGPFDDPPEADGRRLPPLERAQREAVTFRRDNAYLRGVIAAAVADLDTDRPRSHVAAELAAALEAF